MEGDDNNTRHTIPVTIPTATYNAIEQCHSRLLKYGGDAWVGTTVSDCVEVTILVGLLRLIAVTDTITLQAQGTDTNTGRLSQEDPIS